MTNRTDQLRPALVAGGGVAAAMLALGIVATVFGFVAGAIYSIYGGFNDGFGYVDPILMVRTFITTQVAMGIGVAAAFWLIAPITADTNLAQVIMRSLLAAIVGAGVVLVFTMLAAVPDALGYVSYRPGPELFWGFANALSSGFSAAGQALVTAVPLAVIAGYGIRLWHARARLTESPVIE